MRKIATSLLALALCAAFAGTAGASTALRISQVYGGNGGTWNQDYVELYNNSGAAISLTGYSLQYGSATTTTGFGTSTVFALSGSIPACGYFLVGLATATSGLALPVAPDVSTGIINASSASGKVLLINAAPAAVPCLGNVNPEPATWRDEVGYGTGAGLCFETTAAPGVTTTTTLLRAGGGTIDSDNNTSDFTAPASGTTLPRNSASPANATCLATPTTSQTWGNLKLLYR